MSRLQVQGRQVGIIFQLSALDEDLLSLWFNTSEGVELILENLTGLGEIQIKLVALAGMLYDDWARWKMSVRGGSGQRAAGNKQ